VLVQQAIFTSLPGELNAGYHLVSRSAEIDDRQARSLGQWGPSHDSLWDHSAVGSVNFHPLDDGQFCISRSVFAGLEYSGRRGQRVLTQMFVLPLAGLARFANHPFRVMEALVAGGRTTWPEKLPAELPPVPLIGRASPVNPANLQDACRRLGAEQLARLVAAALAGGTLGIVSDSTPHKLLSCLLDLLPLDRRPDFSLTTGLRPALQRPFRLTALPNDAAEQRRAAARYTRTLIDLGRPLPTEYRIDSGWPRLVHQLLTSRQYSQFGSALRELVNVSETEPDRLAEILAPQLGQCVVTAKQ
jgi:hypothetical protein